MITKFICIANDKEISFEDCLACATGPNHCGMPAEVILGIISSIKDFSSEPNEIHVTELLGCIRNVYLTKTRDVATPPSSLYYAFRGKLTHSIVESYKSDERNIIETRYKRRVGDLVITGKPDVIYPHKKTIRDYKTCAKVPRFNTPYTTHREQLEIYKWLVAETIPIDNLEVAYLSMTEPKLCLVKKQRSLEEIGLWVQDKANQLHKALTEDVVPDVPKTFPVYWQCTGYCAVNKYCAKLWQEKQKSLF